MISLHYTSHTKAYNTIYTACNIVEAIYSFTYMSSMQVPTGANTLSTSCSSVVHLLTSFHVQTALLN